MTYGSSALPDLGPQGCNLYIKNLDESLSDDWLRTTFGKFGTITSARVMRDPHTQVRFATRIC